MARRPVVLWTDDDGQDRFLYEELVIQSEGWDVAWALDVSSAARRLASEPFDALILDQMLPYDGLLKGDVLWGGCLVLRWVRGKGPPNHLILDPQGALSTLGPDERNIEIPAFIVSGFHDVAVEAATRDASALDRNIVLVPKPVDIGVILQFLRRAAAEQGRD